MDRQTLQDIVRRYRAELNTLPYTQELINRMVETLERALYRSYNISKE